MNISSYARIKLAIEVCLAALENMDKATLWNQLNADGFLLDRLGGDDQRVSDMLRDKLQDADLGFLQETAPPAVISSDSSRSLSSNSSGSGSSSSSSPPVGVGNETGTELAGVPLTLHQR